MKRALSVALFLVFCLVGTAHTMQITDIYWAQGTQGGVIGISVDAWPAAWGDWTCYLNGKQVPMEGAEEGDFTIRPNAPLENPPTGLWVGAQPWLSTVRDTDFPCAGTLQFDVTGEGLTNIYEFNLVDDGCKTNARLNKALAWNPSPEEDAEDVAADRTLSWTPGDYAVSHNVYLGTNKNTVAGAIRLAGDIDGSGKVDFGDVLALSAQWLQSPIGPQPSSDLNDDSNVNLVDYAEVADNWMVLGDGTFGGHYVFDANSFSPEDLGFGETYYWRIDEVNIAELNSPWTGDVWSFRTIYIEPNIVGWWKFDETSGSTAADSSRYGHDGQVTGAAWAQGRIDGALEFEGGDYVSAPNDVFSSVSSEITVTLWQYGSQAVQPQNDHILEATDGSGNRVLNISLPWGDGNIYWDAGNDGSSYDSISQSAEPNKYEGKWNFWAFTKNAGTGRMNIYLNGEPWHSGTGKTRTMDGVAAFRIGSSAVGGSNYDGLIDDLRIYNRQLDANEIFYYYANMAYDEDCHGPYIMDAPAGFVPDVTHSADLVISGTDTMTIEDVNYLQQGHIYINDQATLILQNAQLAIATGDVATVHTYIFVSENASLQINNSLIFPAPQGQGGLVCVFNSGTVDMTDSPTCIHYFDNFVGAKLTMNNSAMLFTIGGLLQIGGGDMTLNNSTIGALALRVPAGGHLDIRGLHSGVHFDSWDVHDMIPEADYNLVLNNTCVLRDDFTGELEHGPYERGWLFFVNPDAHVRIADSEIRKVFLDLVNDDVTFENLRIGIRSSLSYRDTVLSNITMMGQWPFGIIDSNATIINSDYLFIQPSGDSIVTLIDSHMVEFIPRNFFGTMDFENGLWTVAGEIIGGVPYHSMENDFTMKGSLKISPDVRQSLRWSDAQVTREYGVIVKDQYSNPIEGAVIKINGDPCDVTDETGRADFSLLLDEDNYNAPTDFEVWQGLDLIAQKGVDFFTETPIIVIKE